MKLRNLLFIGLASAALFAGCKEEDPATGTPSITIDPTSLTFAQGGETKSITLTASRDWVVEVPAAAKEWLTVSPPSGPASNDPQTITIEAQANTGANRNVQLVFNASLVSATLQVSQEGPEGGSAFEDFDNAEVGAAVTAEGVVVGINNRGVIINEKSSNLCVYYNETNTPPTVKIGDRVSVSGTKDEHNGFYQLAITSYDSIELLYEGNNVDYPDPIIVNADSFSSLDRAACVYIQFEGTLSISGNYYNVAIDGVSSTGSLQYPRSDLNLDSYKGQRAVFTGYQCAGGSGFLNMLVVSVAPSTTPYFDVSPLNVSFPAAGGTSNPISISGNVAWTAVSSDSDNFKVSVSEGNGAGSFTITATENTTGSDRSATITVATTDVNVDTKSYSVEITQTSSSAAVSDIFFSEYVEGSSNNKYLEIYNPTNQVIELSNYAIDLNTNGGDQWSKDKNPTSNNYTELSGQLAPKSVLVLRHTSADIYEGETVVLSNAVNFNGNDPVGLFKDGVLIDIIGTFNGGSADFAKDVTLRRKASATAPSTTYYASDWDELSKDDVSGLGSHTVE